MSITDKILIGAWLIVVGIVVYLIYSATKALQNIKTPNIVSDYFLWENDVPGYGLFGMDEDNWFNWDPLGLLGHGSEGGPFW